MLFGKYTMGSLITELLAYFVIAALGMFALGNYLYKNSFVAFFIALSYALSGMMVGSAQLMVFVAGIAWLPWCCLSLIRFYQTLQLKYILISGLFFALNTVSASPAFTIVLVYIYLLFFSVILVENRANFLQIKKIIASGIVFLVVIFVLLSPYINAFFEFSTYFNRLTKLPYQEFLLSNPFAWADYLSFLFPYTVISDSKIFATTDLSLRNGYIGLVGLFGVILALFYVRNKKILFLWIGIVLALLLALGNATFLYKIFYHLPGFGVFRHPSFFKSYALFLLLIVSGFGWLHVVKKSIFSSIEKKLLVVFLSIFLLATGIAFYKTSLNEITENIKNVMAYVEFSPHLLSTHLVINTVLVFAILMLVLVLKKAVQLSLIATVILFALLDMGMQTQLTFPTTISHNFSYSTFKTYFNQLPNQINQKDNDKPLNYFDETQGLAYTKGIWKNMSTFNKTISYVGYNPFGFKTFDTAKKTNVLALNLQNPILFTPTKMYQPTDSSREGYIWNVSGDIHFSNQPLLIKNCLIDYNAFSATLKNESKKTQWLLLNQNYHHLWNATYNGKNLPVYEVNELIMGVEIPAKSEGKIIFSFASKRTIYFLIMSMIGYFFIGIYFLFKQKQTN